MSGIGGHGKHDAEPKPGFRSAYHRAFPSKVKPTSTRVSELKFGQNTFLQDLQYNLEFHRWSDLFAIAVKARSDAEHLYGLVELLACRSDELDERWLNTPEHSPSWEAKLHFSGQVQGVAEKLDASVAVLGEVRARTRNQVVTIYNETVPGPVPVEVEVESFFSPGKKLMFLDDAREYDRCLRSCLV